MKYNNTEKEPWQIEEVEKYEKKWIETVTKYGGALTVSISRNEIVDDYLWKEIGTRYKKVWNGDKKIVVFCRDLLDISRFEIMDI